MQRRWRKEEGEGEEEEEVAVEEEEYIEMGHTNVINCLKNKCRYQILMLN